MRFLTIILLLLILPGCNLLNLPDQGKTDQGTDQKDDSQPSPNPSPSPAGKESDYWEALAKLVEADRFQNTDQILGVVASQKQMGNLKDDARVSEFKAKRIQIDQANRAAVASKLRGK